MHSSVISSKNIFNHLKFREKTSDLFDYLLASNSNNPTYNKDN